MNNIKESEVIMLNPIFKSMSRGANIQAGAHLQNQNYADILRSYCQFNTLVQSPQILRADFFIHDGRHRR